MSRPLIAAVAGLAALGGAAFVLSPPHSAAAKLKADPPAVHAVTSSRAATSPAAELPPECVHVTISDNSGNGPVLYTIWCGTGSAGESPMMTRARNLIVDGTALRALDCTRAKPCIILWPSSPAS